GSATTDETFIWYQASPRLQLGVAHLLKQNAFRGLASYNVLPEKVQTPALNVSVGVQGIGTGNPGYSGTLEKNWKWSTGSLNVYAGLGFRANEDHAHAVGGAKFTFPNGIALGIQDEGHERNPFVTYSRSTWTVGIYLVGGKRAAYLVGNRF
ncbi:MAG TPA: hypothetical protein VK934_10675, partial [Fimbriimonas sp.]|nr:hypothetical protein [Fimbriimonas sp.]